MRPAPAMLLGPLRAVTLLFAFVAAAPVLASPAQNAAEPAPGEMRAWLLRIHQAASRNNFQGTFVVSGGGNVTSARIAHFCSGADQFERIESLDGRERNVYRHNNVVHTLWPSTHVAVVEQREVLISFPALLQSGGEGVADYYDVQTQGEDRVAGHAAEVLLVKPKDAYRYGYRLWAEKATGLLLRADVLETGGHVLETSSFSEVTIGIEPQLDSVLRPMKQLAGYHVLHPEMTTTNLQDEGWSLRRTAPGFRQVRCVNRRMDMTDDAAADDKDVHQRVLQAIYSDGLTYVSVFIEPFRPGRRERPMLTAIGATRTLMLRQGDWFITVVGDTPAATLRFFADALQRVR